MIQELFIYHIDQVGTLHANKFLPFHKYIEVINKRDVFEFKLIVDAEIRKERRGKRRSLAIEETHMVVILFLTERYLLKVNNYV